MTNKTILIFTFLVFSFFNISNAADYLREHKLSDRVSIFSEDDGVLWGAKVDGNIVVKPAYSGIDLLGEHYLRLIKVGDDNKKISYGASDMNGAIQLECEYEYIAILQGRLQAFKPPVILEDKSVVVPTLASAAPIHKQVAKETSTPFNVDSEETNSDVAALVEDKPQQKPKIDLSLIRTTMQANNEPKTEADKMPSFQGGEEKMQQFIRDNLVYPEDAKVQGIQGRVVVRFVVMPNGNAEQVEVLHGLETSCDREAVRIVELMPRWIPGIQNGKKVPVYFTLPISFFF